MLGDISWFPGNPHPPAGCYSVSPTDLSQRASFVAGRALSEDCTSVFKRTDSLRVPVRNQCVVRGKELQLLTLVSVV